MARCDLNWKVVYAERSEKDVSEDGFPVSRDERGKVKN